MLKHISEKLRWFATVWTDSKDAGTQAYRRHVRGLFIGWALTAVAVALIELFPNEAKLSMYDMLRTPELPWQQHWLAAMELAGPLVMAWHLAGLHRWGRRGLAQR
jgi:hypothetical protein